MLSGVSQARALNYTSVDPRRALIGSHREQGEPPPAHFAGDRPPDRPSPSGALIPASGHTARTAMFPDASRRPHISTALVAVVALAAVAAATLACTPPRDGAPTPKATIAMIVLARSL